MTREDFIYSFDNEVEKAIIDNFDELTKNQLHERVFTLLFNWLDKNGFVPEDENTL